MLAGVGIVSFDDARDTSAAMSAASAPSIAMFPSGVANAPAGHRHALKRHVVGWANEHNHVEHASRTSRYA